jgi:RecA-family ATPase
MPDIDLTRFAKPMENSEPSQHGVITSPSPIGFRETFEEDPPAPKSLLPGILPRNVCSFVGEGGIAKSTVELWMMIHCILGQPCLGREWVDPGPCLYITAEDEIDLVRYRVRRLCDGMRLSQSEQYEVAARLFIEDVSGKMMRFVESDSQGNLSLTKHLDDIIAAYGNQNIVWACADPTVFFGPGERFVNDAEAALMQAGRYLSHGLGGCTFQFIHHVGQSAAREKVVDQYAGRGGSALADNGRGTWVMVAHSKDDEEYPRPTSVLPSDVKDGRVMRLHVPKYSIGEQYRKPIWLVRQHGNWFDIRYHEHLEPTPEERKAQKKEEKGTTAALVAMAAHEYIDELGPGIYPSLTQIIDGLELEGVKLGRDKKRAYLNSAAGKGVIIVEPLPEGVTMSGRKNYVTKGRSPQSVTWP